MSTILICGHGPGISDAMAHRFGAEGFAVGLVARSGDRLAGAVTQLASKGIRAAAFPTDLTDAQAVVGMVQQVRRQLGPITVVHWNAYGGGGGDLTRDDLGGLRSAFDLSVSSLVAAVQSSLPDLREQKGKAAILVTGGGLAFYDGRVDAMAVQWNAMGLAIGKAAQHKLAGLLHQKLAPEGIYVGEVVVMGSVKGTAFDHGQATLEASRVAGRFWELYTARTDAISQIQ